MLYGWQRLLSGKKNRPLSFGTWICLAAAHLARRRYAAQSKEIDDFTQLLDFGLCIFQALADLRDFFLLTAE